MLLVLTKIKQFLFIIIKLKIYRLRATNKNSANIFVVFDVPLPDLYPKNVISSEEPFKC